MSIPIRNTLLAGLVGLLAWGGWSWLSTRPSTSDQAGSPEVPVQGAAAQPLEPSHSGDEPRSPLTDSALAPSVETPRTAPEPASPFRIHGVAAPWPPPWNSAESAVARLFRDDGFEWIQIGTAHVSQAGEFELEAPDQDSGAPSRVTLEGQSLARTFLDISAGGPGESAEVELSVEHGSTLLLAAIDPEGNRITDARFRLEWGADWKSLSALVAADGTGVATLHGAPAGRVVPYASAPGWATGKHRALQLPRDANRLQSFTLEPSGRLVGRCLQDGRPISDFAITTWRMNDTSSSVRRVFRDRQDGSFEIENVHAGWVLVSGLLPGGRTAGSSRSGSPRIPSSPSSPRSSSTVRLPAEDKSSTLAVRRRAESSYAPGSPTARSRFHARTPR